MKDSLGHFAGDKVLVEAAKRILNQLPDGSFAGRCRVPACRRFGRPPDDVVLGRPRNAGWGGITKGPLVHIQGGHLFGPALNEAYHLESKIASFPRIVMSDDCWSYFSSQPTFPTLEFFFDLDEDGYRSMSLAGAYRQILEASPMFMLNPKNAVPMLRKLADTPSRLRAIKSSFAENRVTSKYDWLIPRVEVLIERYKLTAGPQASGK